MIRNRIALTAAIAGLCALPLAAQTDTSSSNNQSQTQTQTGASDARTAQSGADRSFVEEAAHGGMAEVELGRLATEKASSDRVKQFGQRMVDDHSKANDELKQAASQQSIDVPADIDAKHKATMDRLSALSGTAFDKAYMDEMVKDHVKDVSAFEKESRRSGDSAVKAFAAKTLPTLREHLSMARDIQREVSRGGSNRPSGSASMEPSNTGATSATTDESAADRSSRMPGTATNYPLAAAAGLALLGAGALLARKI
jgi:putative membrane protein